MSSLPTTRTDAIEAVIAKGDLAQLTPQERVNYYRATCESLGLNPLTKPFEYITLNGKVTLYARKDAADQLRKAQGVSIVKLEREKIDGLYVVTATAQDANGRQDSAIGAVNIEGLKGDALANAMMKAETKAKRRVTLSICGLGWTDESEIESIPNAQAVVVDAETGEIATPRETQQAQQPEAQGWAAWPENWRKAFWAKCRELGLSDAAVHDEFGVESMAEYTGSAGHAGNVLKILAYGFSQGLRLDQVCDALAVDILDEYDGDVQTGISDINAYVEQRVQSAEELPQ